MIVSMKPLQRFYKKSQFDARQYETFFYSEWLMSQFDDPGYGIRVIREEGEYQVIGIHHLTPQENRWKHNCMASVLNEDGQRILDPFHFGYFDYYHVGNENKQGEREAQDAFPMWSNVGNNNWISMASGDRVEGLGTLHPDEPGGNSLGHHSFFVVFIKAKSRPDQPEEELPRELPTEASVEAEIDGYISKGVFNGLLKNIAWK